MLNAQKDGSQPTKNTSCRVTWNGARPLALLASAAKLPKSGVQKTAGPFLGDPNGRRLDKIGNYGYACQTTCPVGKFSASPYGLFALAAMFGNGVRTWYDETQETRVLRGASWRNLSPQVLSCTYRGAQKTDMRCDDIGFRIVLALNSSCQ